MATSGGTTLPCDKRLFSDSYRSPCRPPLLGLTRTRSGCVPGRGLIWRQGGGGGRRVRQVCLVTLKTSLIHIIHAGRAHLQSLSVSGGEFKNLIDVVWAGAGRRLAFTPLHHRMTVLTKEEDIILVKSYHWIPNILLC